MGILTNEIGVDDQSDVDESKGSILVVDDNVSLCRSLTLILNKAGYSSIGVETGAAALSALELNHFDIAIVDMRLPDMDGTELLSKLNAIDSEMENIIITGHASVETAIRAMEKKSSAYLTKPLDMERTMDTIARLMDKRKLISQKRRAEQSLAESEQWFRSIFNDSPIAINVFDADGQILAANEAMLQFSGVSGFSEISTLNLFDDPNTPEEENARIRSGEKVYTEKEFNFDLVRQFGIYPTTKSGIVYIHSGITPLRYGNSDEIHGYIVQIVDETAKVKTKQLLHESEALFRGIFEQSPIAIELFDKDGNLLRANQAALNLFGVTSVDDFKGLNLFSDPNALPWVQDELKLGNATRIEQKFDFNKTKSFNVYPSSKTGVLYLDIINTPIDINNDGKYDGFLSQIRDITENKISEDKLTKQAHQLNERVKELSCLHETARLLMSGLPLDALIEELLLVFQKALQYPENTSVQIKYHDSVYTSPDFVETEWSISSEIQISNRIIGEIIIYYTEEKPPEYKGPFLEEEVILIDALADKLGNYIEKQNAQLALVESEKKYRKLFDNLTDGVTLTDFSGNLKLCNDIFLQVFGYSEDEAIGMNFREFLHPECRDQALSEFITSVDSTKTASDGIELTGLKRDGSSFYINIQNSIVYEYEQPIGYQSVIRDVTQEKLAEIAILDERDKAQRYLDIAGAIIVVVDRDGIVELINRKGSEILGCSIDRVVGKNWIQNFIPQKSQNKARDDFSRLLEGVESAFRSKEGPILTKSGYEHIIEWRNSAIYDSEENIIGVVSSGVDITERKQAEDNLKNTADSARLYLDIMGHDIRNHLQAIVMGTDIMSHQDLSVEDVPIFELIVESVESSQKLIDQVQATRELLSTPLELVSLSEIFIEFTESVTKIFSDVDFHIESNVHNEFVLADQYLKVLCRNLVDNAVYHNPNTERSVWILLQKTKDGFLISVKDNGNGIPDSRKESLFDPGRRYGGVGIHQAKNIVEKYNGHISVADRVEGDPSQGTSFDVWIPKHKENQNQ